MHIGVLEDNPVIADYLTTALQLAGHTIQVFRDGPSLLATLFTEAGLASYPPYALITVDLLLPGAVSGLDVIRSIRERIPSERLPIIVISGASEQYLEQAAHDFPQVSILRKPFKMNALLALIEQMTSLPRQKP